MTRNVLQGLIGFILFTISACSPQQAEPPSGSVGSVQKTLLASWNYTGSTVNLDGFTNHTATVLPSGKVLVAGGYSSSGYQAGAELYDPATGTWTSAGTLTDARASHTATLLSNGKVVIAGGENSSGILASVEIYDPTTGTWSSAADMQVAHANHSAVEVTTSASPLVKQLLVIGGSDSSYSEQTAVELFDPVAGTWSYAAPLSTARTAFTAVVLASGQVLVAGGYSSFVSIDAAETYEPISDTWSSTGSLLENRSNYTATVLSSGEVLVTGGLNYDPLNGFRNLSSAEVYVPGTGTWSSAGSLPYNTAYSDFGRTGHAAVLLSTGEVLVAGGTGNAVNQSAVLYDPATNTWSSTADLNSPRSEHSLSLLPSGEVLAVGGYYDPTAAEVYTP
jgi:large repetitive protein